MYIHEKKSMLFTYKCRENSTLRLSDGNVNVHRKTPITLIFIVTPCMLSSYSIITPTTAHTQNV